MVVQQDIKDACEKDSNHTEEAKSEHKKIDKLVFDKN
jgi:hypothetical protein